MALTNDPVFAQTPKTGGFDFDTGSEDTSMDPAAVSPDAIVTAGADGAIVTSVVYHGEVTITAQKIVLWIQPLGTGDWFIVKEALQAAYTMAATTAQTAVTLVDKTDPNSAIRLAGTDVLGVTHHVDLAGSCFAEWTDY